MVPEESFELKRGSSNRKLNYRQSAVLMFRMKNASTEAVVLNQVID